MHAPRTRALLLPRAELEERVREALRAPVALLCASAASGKSTLLRRVVRTLDAPVAWLNLDACDEDPVRLAAHVVAAIRTITPDACEPTSEILTRSREVTATELGEMLARDLDAIERPFVFVLDNYESVPGADVHALFEPLLRYPPAALHLVIVARHDPPLPLQPLRLQGRWAEIRQEALAFTPDETGGLLELIWDRDVSAADAARVHASFEGWVGGISLWATSVRRDGPDAALAGLRSTAHVVDSYLRDQVLERLPRAVQDGLVQCTFLREFTVGLLSAVLAEDDLGISAREFLDRLEEERVFLVAVDGPGPGRWYRFRRVFAEFLDTVRDRSMDEAQVRALHDRAAAWYDGHGLFREAVDHALLGSAPESAAEIVAAHRLTLLNEGRWPELAQLLTKLPAGGGGASLELQLARAWLAPTTLMDGAVGQLERAIANAGLAEEAARAARGELAFLRVCAVVGGPQGDAPDLGAQVALLEEALGLLPGTHREARAGCRHLLAVMHQMNGDIETALAVLEQGLAEHASGQPLQLVALLHGACIVHEAEADLAAVQDAALRCISLSKRTRSARPVVDLVTALLAKVHYEWNELERAEELLERIPFDEAPGAQLLWARVAMAAGREQEAVAAVEAALGTFGAEPDEHSSVFGRSVEAWLALRRGRLPDALRWAERAHPWRVRPRHDAQRVASTAAEILIAGGAPTHLERAEDLLEHVLGHARGTHNRIVELRALAIAALLRAASGDETGAREALLQSLELSRRGRFLSTYSELGDGMQCLLASLRPPAELAAYVALILQTFDGTVRPAAAPAPQPLMDPLSNRELEVLGLLAERLSNKEIAGRLFISTETVKRHASTIYQKLHVHRRRDAVERARALGLLEG